MFTGIEPHMIRSGQQKIDWAFAHMPVLKQIAEDFDVEKPFQGLRVAASIHVEAKTACLAKVLARGGAEVALTGCNPLSTQDDVAAALAQSGIQVYCRHGVDTETYFEHLRQTLAFRPHLIIDDGGDFAQLLHTSCKDLAADLIGGSEETTTGVKRLRILEKAGRLAYPVIAVNDARCKHLFDNRYGTGQSVLTAIMAATNLLIAGKVVVVAGFGMCGKGVAQRAYAMGARVIITEVDPVRACEALMEGYDVMSMKQAAAIGDLFITVTGCCDVITKEHILAMKNGAILCNAGHFDVEINLQDLKSLSQSVQDVRAGVESYQVSVDKSIRVLAKGRLVNLAAGDGHPAEIMDMSFALQALSARYLVRYGRSMKPGVYEIPEDIDRTVARAMLATMDKAIDELSPDQVWYLENWDLDTDV
ncbi:MAG: adenosylhomocysteinase [Clostridiaceae bacterium]|nr:adenosylhomocysteinase [Clostridiaceae bacterium]